MEGKIYKIEVAKNNGNFYFTGTIEDDPSDSKSVIVKTIKGETLTFWKSQIVQRCLLKNNPKPYKINK